MLKNNKHISFHPTALQELLRAELLPDSRSYRNRRMSGKAPFPQALAVKLHRSFRDELKLLHLVWDGREGTDEFFLYTQKRSRF